MKNVFILVAFLLTFSLNAQIQVFSLIDHPDIPVTSGFIYALPQTEITFTVKVKKSEHFKGPYAEFATKYLNTTNVIKSNHSTYSIVDVQMETQSIPDPVHYYFVQFPKKNKKNIISFHLNENGFLTDMTNIENKKSMNESMEKYIDNSFQASTLFKYQSSSNLVEVTDTIIRKIIIDTITVSKMFFEKKWTLKGSEQNAREAAKMLQKIKESRYNLLTGYQEVAYDGLAISYMDSELQKMEQEYLAMFSGATIVKEFSYTFTVIPKDIQDDMIAVFSFSERSGIHHASSKLGETIYLEMNKLDNQQMNPLDYSQEGENQGIYYRIPLWMNLSMEINSDLLIQGKYPIPQLGSLSRLPADVRAVGLDANTGNVKMVLLK
jgi:hypothetical protein